MTWHLHHLTGCAPAPLAHYLKALGILRVIGEQADDTARGWWQDEHFCLLTTLDRPALETFLLGEYAPTPVFNPWGARSGFYPDPSEKTARVALERIEGTTTVRLAPFRAAISIVRAALNQSGDVKPDTDEAKQALLGALRREVRGAAHDWISCVMTLVGGRFRAPALLGTGGNEGSGSYSSAYLNAVVSCVVEQTENHALGLYSASDAASGPKLRYTWGGSFGQFIPDGAGSVWDLVLAIEGASLLRSGVGIRSDVARGSFQRLLSSPFFFGPYAAGSGSASLMDEFSVNKGRRNPGRGEQWFPMWRAPMGLAELQSLFAEGRCSVGCRHATHAIDAARAVGMLGVARGLESFARYGYLQRNNLATHFAVPLGRIAVRERPRTRLIDDLSAWLERLHIAARDDHAAARFVSAERRLADAVFAVLTHDDEPARWQAVLSAATGVEAVQASGTGFAAGPIPPLSPDWVMAADDGSAEWRLARSLGSAAAGYDRAGKPHDSVRHHWLPLEEHRPRFKQREKRLVGDVSVVMTGRDPVADLAALVERRLVEAASRGQRQLPLIAARGCEARPADLARFVAGEVNADRVSTLARALMAVRWSEWRAPRSSSGSDGDRPAAAWTAVRLACLAWPEFDGRAIPVDRAIVRRLVSGDGSAAVALALRRLVAAGLRPPLRAACCDARLAQLWAAALVFPVSLAGARALARQFLASE